MACGVRTTEAALTPRADLRLSRITRQGHGLPTTADSTTVIFNRPLAKLVQWNSGRKNRPSGGFFMFDARQCANRGPRPEQWPRLVDSICTSAACRVRPIASSMPGLATRPSCEQNPACELVCIKYFTADVTAKFSPRGSPRQKAQRRHRPVRLDLMPRTSCLPCNQSSPWRNMLSFLGG